MVGPKWNGGGVVNQGRKFHFHNLPLWDPLQQRLFSMLLCGGRGGMVATEGGAIQIGRTPTNRQQQQRGSQHASKVFLAAAASCPDYSRGANAGYRCPIESTLTRSCSVDTTSRSTLCSSVPQGPCDPDSSCWRGRKQTAPWLPAGLESVKN